jgi:hypothetical protein
MGKVHVLWWKKKHDEFLSIHHTRYGGFSPPNENSSRAI